MLGARMGLADNIEKARIAAGYTNAAEFARLIGVSAGTLGDWEGGRYEKLRLDNLLKIAKGARCRVEDLVVGVDEDYDGLWRDLPDHGTGKDSDFGRRSDVPASPRVPAVDPVLVKTLENLGALITKAIARAKKRERVPDENAGTRAPQSGKRRRAGGDR